MKFITTILLSLITISLYAQSAFMQLAESCAKERNYVEAIRLAKLALEGDSASYGLGREVQYDLLRLASFCRQSGDIDYAIYFGTKAMNLAENLYSNKSSQYALAVDNLSLYYSLKPDYEKAVQLALTALPIFKEINGEESYDYAVCMKNIATYYTNIGEYDLAEQYSANSLEVFAKLGEAYKLNYAIALDERSLLFANRGLFDDAIKLGEKAVSIFSENALHVYDLSISQYNLGNFYLMKSDYANAIFYEKESLKHLRDIYGKSNPVVIERINDLMEKAYSGVILSSEEENHKGVLDCAQWYVSMSNIKDPKYSKMTHYMSKSYENLGDFENAIDLEKKLLNELDSLGISNFSTIQSLQRIAYLSQFVYGFKGRGEVVDECNKRVKFLLATNVKDSLTNDQLYDVYIQLGVSYENVWRTKDALDYFTTVKSLIEKNNDTHSAIYANLLSNMGILYKNSGDFINAIRFLEDAINLKKGLYGDSSVECYRTYYNLALCLESFSRIDDAIKVFENIEQLYIKKNLVSKEETAAFYIDFGALYGQNHHFSKRVEYGELALNIYEELYQDGNLENGSMRLKEDFVQALLFVANTYIDLAAFDPEYGKMAKELYSRIIETMGVENDLNPISIQAINNLAYMYFNEKKYSETLKLYEDLLLRLKSDLSQSNLYYQCLNMMLKCYVEIHEYKGIEEICRELFGSIKSILINNFIIGTNRERKDLYDQYVPIISETIPYALLSSPEAIDTEMLYNSCLMTKGILFSTEKVIENIIKENDDTKDLYNRIKNIEKSNSNLGNDYESNNEIEQLRRQLMLSISNHSDVVDNLNITWYKIRGALDGNAGAIEFIDLEYDNNHHLYAMLVKEDSDIPICVELCDFPKSSYGMSMSPNDIYNKIWKPLTPYLSGVKKIYFSPAGILHSLPIEIAEDDNTEFISDKWDIYRLTSTRELINPVDSISCKSFALYGGLDYESSMAQTKPESTANADNQLSNSFYRGSRGTVEYLPNTLDEVLNIKTMLGDTINTYLFTGTDGTEESFNSLTYKDVNIIHIASHGFYYTKEDIEDYSDSKQQYQFMLFDDDYAPFVDKSMTRSGIALSGANNTLRGKQVPAGVEDGILTSQEISLSDFKNLDLVVLSTCESGLGEATSEGVFGLQRGFKKAGAKAILMSLWDVDDKATSLLMTEFYKHLLSGKSKRESLSLAQATLRQHPDYSDPHYWAAFILLDALN